jgi:hypothetical protein
MKSKIRKWLGVEEVRTDMDNVLRAQVQWQNKMAELAAELQLATAYIGILKPVIDRELAAHEQEFWNGIDPLSGVPRKDCPEFVEFMAGNAQAGR